jgi:hypothetical protein
MVKYYTKEYKLCFSSHLECSSSNSSGLYAEANEDYSFSSQSEKQVRPVEAKAHGCPNLHQLK